MFAADTDVQVRIFSLTKLDCHFHQLADTILVKFCKWVVFEDLSLVVCFQELACVITGESESHLCQVVGSEAEEVCIFCDLICGQSCTRDLNHGTYLILQVCACCCDLFICSIYHCLLYKAKLFVITDQWNHDFRTNTPVWMFLLYVDGCTDDCSCLHLGDLRISNSQTNSTMSHHWIEFVQGIDDTLDLFYGLALRISQLLDIFVCLWYEFMQRRIQETDGYRVAFQCFVKFLKVTLLNRKNLFQCCFSFFYGIGADHLTECIDSVSFEEHMLGTAKSDTFCAQFSCFLCICWCICIGSYFQSSILISPSHNTAKFAGDRSIYSLDHAIVNISGGTINGDPVSFMVFFSGQCELLVCFIHMDVTASGYTAGSHSTSYYCCMAGHTSTNGQDTLGCLHTFDIFR